MGMGSLGLWVVGAPIPLSKSDSAPLWTGEGPTSAFGGLD